MSIESIVGFIQYDFFVICRFKTREQYFMFAFL